MSVEIVLGADVGTTDSKVLVATTDGQEILSVTTATTWQTRDGRFTEMAAETLAAAVLGLLEQAARQAQAQLGEITVVGIAITGMGESGVLLDSDNRPVQPLLAWFDPRGAQEIRALPAEVIAEFTGRTGLPIGPQATIGKLGWMRDQGVSFAGKTWLSVGEYLIFRLGGRPAAEWSLFARTGLLDQESDTPWPAALAAVGADPSLIPPLVCAGTPLGRASDAHGPVPQILHGAALTVAGHDHPVAAVGCGTVGPDELFDSFGTAEAFVQTVPKLSMAARKRLADQGVDCVYHVLGGRRALLGGTKAGLILRRTLRLLGSDDADGRVRIDAAERALPAGTELTRGVEVGGAANNDGTLTIAATSDDVTPAVLWRAALDTVIAEADRVLGRMAAEVGPAGSAVVAGGWTAMASLRAAKERSLPNVRFTTRRQAGAFGAALFAAFAAETACEMAEAGDPTADRLLQPIGPTPDFAAAFVAGPVAETSAGRALVGSHRP